MPSKHSATQKSTFVVYQGNDVSRMINPFVVPYPSIIHLSNQRDTKWHSSPYTYSWWKYVKIDLHDCQLSTQQYGLISVKFTTISLISDLRTSNCDEDRK